ncbi:MAG: hypothetical protein HC903_25445 [Methylacidiphilales bacterium]|nr:hypothetical protein [Candidatus Methylacidiphilales bacterium]
MELEIELCKWRSLQEKKVIAMPLATTKWYRNILDVSNGQAKTIKNRCA